MFGSTNFLNYLCCIIKQKNTMKTYVIISKKSSKNDQILMMEENVIFNSLDEMKEYLGKDIEGDFNFLQLGSFLKKVSIGFNYVNSLGYCKVNN